MRLKFNFSEMEAFLLCIEAAISTHQQHTDEDCLIVATLEELQLKLAQKFLERKQKYAVTLKPAQAFAIRCIYAGHGRYSYEGNLIGKICDEAHQLYYK